MNSFYINIITYYISMISFLIFSNRINTFISWVADFLNLSCNSFCSKCLSIITNTPSLGSSASQFLKGTQLNSIPTLWNTFIYSEPANIMNPFILYMFTHFSPIICSIYFLLLLWSFMLLFCSKIFLSLNHNVCVF